MRFAIMPILLFLAACGQSPDGYTFEQEEFDRRSQTVTVVEHPTLTALHQAAPEEALTDGRDLQGFSLIRPGTCEIHITDLRKSDARMWLGHEMTHCIYGRWHQ